MVTFPEYIAARIHGKSGWMSTDFTLPDLEHSFFLISKIHPRKKGHDNFQKYKHQVHLSVWDGFQVQGHFPMKCENV